MKTKKYIITMLIALIFGITTIQAQSARRAAPQQKNERAKTTRTHTSTKKATPQKARTVQPTRQVQKQKAQKPKMQAKRATQPVQKQQVQRKQAQKPQVQRQKSTQQVQRKQAQKPQVQRQKSTQQVQRKQAQKPQAQRQRTTQQVQRKQAQKPQVQRQRSTQQVQRQRTTQPARKPVSMSTTKNPRSTYRTPNNKVSVKNNRTVHNRVNKYSTQRYYGGNHYHYVYPTRKVKFHYHHDTYVHNYHVLYYPTYRNIYWSRNMYRDYRRWYPEYHWRYNYGYRIQTISVFDAKYNLGEVAMVYGRVYATWHNRETDDFLLFFGGDYPNQHFTVVLPGRIARRFSWRPERYFLGEHLTVTGLITTFDGIPEVIVKNKRQVGLY